MDTIRSVLASFVFDRSLNIQGPSNANRQRQLHHNQQQDRQQRHFKQPAVELQAMACPKTAVACQAVRARSRLLSMPTEIRVMILKEVLSFDRNEAYEVQMPRLNHKSWENIAQNPHRGVPSTFDNEYLQGAVRDIRRYDVSADVFRVCRQLGAEAMDVAYSENSFIALVDAPLLLVAKFDQVGIRQLGIFGRERYKEQALRPTLEIRFETKQVPSTGIAREVILIPFFQIGRLGLALHAVEGYRVLQKMSLVFWSCADLIRAYKCKTFDAAKRRLQVDLIQWIGAKATAVFVQQDRLGQANPSFQIGKMCWAMIKISASDNDSFRYRLAIIGMQFESAHKEFAAGNLNSAYKAFIELKERMVAVASKQIEIRGRITTGDVLMAQHAARMHELHGMLSWIFYQMASKPAQSEEEQVWQPLFAIRAIYLSSSFEPNVTWRLRMYLKITELLIALRATRLWIIFTMRRIDDYARPAFQLSAKTRGCFEGHYYRLIRDRKLEMAIEEMPINEADAESLSAVLSEWKTMVAAQHGTEPIIDPAKLKGYKTDLALHPLQF